MNTSTKAITDWLGTEIKVGQKAIRADNKYFDKCQIAKLRDEYPNVGIKQIGDGGSVRWTYARRLIVEDSLTIEI